MSNFCQTGISIDTQEKWDNNYSKNFHKIFKKWVDDRAKEQDVKYTIILNELLDRFEEKDAPIDYSTIARWYNGTRTASKDNLNVLSDVTGIPVEVYITGTLITDADKDYLDKIDLDEQTANVLYEINNRMHWNYDNLNTMRKLEITTDNSNGIIHINKASKYSPLPLFPKLNKRFSTVTLSEIIKNSVTNKDATVKILRHLSEIENVLSSWKYNETDPDLLDRLNDFRKAKSVKYEDFYRTLPPDIREKIRVVEEEVSNMVKFYILDKFINNKK